MLSFGDGFDHRSAAMEVRQYIRPDVTLSAIVHLTLVACVVIYTEVRPFRSVAEKAVPVDVIIADEKKPEPLPTPEPSPDLSMLAKPEPPAATAPATAPAASPPPPEQASRASRREVPAQPQPQAPEPAATPAPSASRGYTPPEPDLTIKYHVMLGLPGDRPAGVSAGDKRGEGGDAGPASDNLASSLVDALRRHLKTCSKLPAALSPSDNVAVKLRVQIKADGRLAAEPALIEGTASMKGVQLMQGAVAALTACQPYAMLPADRYGEWKVLDLSFTPHDFNF